MGSVQDRPAGITAVSSLLVTIGALVCGAALLAICADMDTLTTVAGLWFEAIMLGFFFSGGLLAGIGVGLYEGYGWARSASLASLAFVATLLVFSLAKSGFRNAAWFEGGLLMLTTGSVLYLSTPASKRFFSPFRQSATASVEAQSAVATVAVPRAS